MPSVFISHAAADKALVDDVKTMIQEAVGLNPTEIFYSSSVGSGIPAGRDFVEHMQSEMRDAGYVVAVITPAYLESMFCLAELGAVWYSTGKEFFPLCIAVDYDELRATLLGIQVPRLDDRASLTDLLQRICMYSGKAHSAGACTEAADKFLATLPKRLEKLQGPTAVSAERLGEAERTRDTLAGEVVDLRDEVEEWKDRFEQAKHAQSLAQIEELEPPSTAKEWVEQTLAEAIEAVNEVGQAVTWALPYHVRGDGMPWPDHYEENFDTVKRAYDEGFLQEGGEDLLYPNSSDWPDIERAAAAVDDAQEALRSLHGDDRTWFIREYEAPPDLSQAAAFRRLLRLRS